MFYCFVVCLFTIYQNVYLRLQTVIYENNIAEKKFIFVCSNYSYDLSFQVYTFEVYAFLVS